jgi:hypothetical protein
MASFVPYYRKKSKQLAKHEGELLLLLQKKAERPKVLMAVEIVRAAHIRTVKSRIAQLPASEKSAAAIEKLENESETWLKLPQEAILDMYRTKTAARNCGRLAG